MPMSYLKITYIEICDKNKDNDDYKSSYEKKGFCSSDYWSSTTNEGYSYFAWIVDFDYGYVGYNNENHSRYVRCVRSI